MDSKKSKRKPDKLGHSHVPNTFLLSNDSNDLYATVTGWVNGEGADCHVEHSNVSAHFQLTWEMWEILKEAVKAHKKALKSDHE